jgi:predicted phage gp36 major capsid-like protein
MGYIQQQNAIIKAYRNYYEESEEALEQANANLEGAKDQVQAQQDLIDAEESTLERLNPFK